MLLAKEKWWLGNDAQKLAVVLARDKDYIHACPIMNFSCEALVSWCYQEKDDALVLGRVQEVLYVSCSLRPSQIFYFISIRFIACTHISCVL